jgi:hypothetical protein
VTVTVLVIVIVTAGVSAPAIVIAAVVVSCWEGGWKAKLYFRIDYCSPALLRWRVCV